MTNLTFFIAIVILATIATTLTNLYTNNKLHKLAFKMFKKDFNELNQNQKIQLLKYV